MLTHYVQKLLFMGLTLSTALLIISLAILSVIKPQFVNNIYQRVESDHFGLLDSQRFDLAVVAVDYLLSNDLAEVAIQPLSAQKLPDGKILYTPDELNHLIDVKNLIDKIRLVLRLTLLTVFIFGGISMFKLKLKNQRYGNNAKEGKQPYIKNMVSSLKVGTLISCLFGLGILLFAILFWRQFFVFFHEVFFLPDTWTFEASAGLIRLFPEAFWFFVGVSLILRIIIFSMAGYFLIHFLQNFYASTNYLSRTVEYTFHWHNT